MPVIERSLPACLLIAVMAGSLPGQCPPTTLFAPGGSVGVPAPLRGVAAADLDEDGRADLVGGGQGTVTLQLSALGSTSVAVPALPVLHDVTLGDFDADGILDVAAVGGSGGPAGVARLVVLLGQGSLGMPNGSWAPTFSVDMPALQAPSSVLLAVEAGDVDRDGILDLVACGSEVWLLAGQGSAGRGDGTFVPFAQNAGFASHDLVLVDFDEDGFLDVAVLQAAANWIVVLLGGPGTGFTQPAVVNLTGANLGSNLTAWDWNADGILDLAAADGHSKVMLVPGQGAGGAGSGTFGAVQTFTVNQAPFDLRGGDFNGDGLQDVAITRMTLQAMGSNVMLLTQAPGGVFSPEIPYTAGTGFPQFLEIEDFTGDGLPDMGLSMLAPKVATVPGACATPLATGITVTAPAAGQVLAAGGSTTVTWTRGPGVGPVDVSLSRDGGSSWQVLARTVSGNQLTWHVSDPATTRARVRVSDAILASRSGSSPDFTITGALSASATPITSSCPPGTPQLTLTTPRIGLPLTLALSTAPPLVPALVWSGAPAATPIPVAGLCDLVLAPSSAIPLLPLTTDATGSFNATGTLPPEPALVGLTLALQALVATPAQSPPLRLSNGLLLTVGY